MNERIRELAQQADMYARSDNSSMLFENYQKRYTEKFAELIVLECADIALKSGNITNKSEQAKAEANRIYYKIQEHFGVE